MRLAVAFALLGLAAFAGAAAAGQAGSSAYCAHTSKVGTGTALLPGVSLNNLQPPLQLGSFPLKACNTVASGVGKARFSLSGGAGVNCIVLPGAKVKVETSKQVLVNFTAGTTWCSTKHKFPNGKGFMAGKDGPLIAGDPLFAVAVAGSGRANVKVARGFLQIGPQMADGTPAAGAQIVGPNEQSVTPSGSSPGSATAVPPSSLAALNNSTLAKALPGPVYSRPSSPTALKKSATLQRIGRNRRIVVGLGPSLAGSDAGDFAQAYFTFLAQHWFPGRPQAKCVLVRDVNHLSSQKCSLVPNVSPGRARSFLKTRRLDLYVGQSPPSATLTAPFFADHAGNKWSFVVVSDPVFLGALTTFLQSALNVGDYDRLYRKSLAQQPPVYQVVAPLIFSPAACAPSPQADQTSELDLSLTLTSSRSGPLLPGKTVVQTATVTNIGRRVVDCVTLHFSIFGGRPLNYAKLLDDGCTSVVPPPGQAEVGEVDLGCEVGRLGLGAKTSRSVVVEPASSPTNTETCAKVDATESGGVAEVNLADNSACAHLAYRDAPLLPGAEPLGPLVVGVVEDVAKEPPNPAAGIPDPLGTLAPQAKFDLLGTAGFGAVVLTAGWVRGESAPSPVETAKLQTAVKAAKLVGMRTILAVYNFDPEQKLTAAQDTPVTAAQRADFAAYAAALARALPTVRQFIVGNEPNNERFWSPQSRPEGTDVAAAAYEALLARTYDALKAVDPNITVIGGALAPTHSPGTFISELGSVYRAAFQKGSRTRPIMDAFAFHPIPESPNIPPSTQHPRPQSVLGIADYPQLVSLLGRAFDGTAQLGSNLPIYYTEYAVQSAPKAGPDVQTGDPVSEKTQAAYYRQAIALASCQPSVAGIFLFHGFDEPKPAGWQSGVYYANGTPKSSFLAVRAAARAARTRHVSSC